MTWATLATVAAACVGQTIEIDGPAVTFRGCAWEWSQCDRAPAGPVLIYAACVMPSPCGPGPDFIADDCGWGSATYTARKFHAWAGDWEIKVFPGGGRWTIRYGAAATCPPGDELVYVLDLGCPADRNHDGAVTVSDLLGFLAAYEAASPGADVDDGTGRGVPDGGVDIADLLAFLAHYAAGC